MPRLQIYKASGQWLDNEFVENLLDLTEIYSKADDGFYYFVFLIG